jgi:O-antigen/teichoic acid export membrane protein
MSSRARIALSGVSWTTIGVGAFAVLQIPVLAILARLISPAEFGIANAALIVFAFGANIFEGGVMLNIAQRKTVSDRDAAIAFQISALLSLALFVVVLLSANQFEAFFKTPDLSLAIQVISLGFLLRGFTGVSEALLFHQRRFRAAALVQLLPFAIGYVPFALGLGFAGYGYWAIVIGHLAMCTVQCVLLVYLARHPVFVKASRREFVEHLSHTIEFSIGRLASYFTVQGDKIIVGRVLGMEALGLYGRAFQIMMIPSKTFTKVVTSVTTPLYASIQDDLERVAKAFRKSVRLANLMMVPVTLAVILFREELVLLLLGDDWVEIADVLGLLAAASYFIVLYRVPLGILHSQRMSRNAAISQSIYAALTVLAVSLVVDYGLSAVAIAVSALAGSNYVMLSIQALRRLGASGWAHLQAHGPGLLAGVGFLIGSILLRHYWDDRYPDLILLFLAGIVLAASIAPGLYRTVKQ